jgi:hypothetical protein
MATNKDIPDGAAADGLGLTDAELKTARKEGAKEDAKEAAKDTHRFLTDGQNIGEAVGRQWTGHDDIMQYAPALDLAVPAFEERIADKSDAGLPEEKVYGLLALERNGQNRTPYVKAMMKRLKLKADELPGGGPAYTNDLTSITDL